MKTGKLYGIGIGPGDPELLTLKALRIIKEAEVIYVAASSKNNYSLAASVVKPHLPAGKELKMLSFPMTYERNELERAWRENAQKVAQELSKGKDVAFLTMGDPCFYSTFSYLARAVKELLPQVEFEIVPGVTAAQAAAARLKMALSEGDETVLFASGASGGKALREFASKVDTIVLYKVYRQAGDIYQALKENGLLEKTSGVSFCSTPKEKVFKNFPDLTRVKLPYFSLFIVGGKPLK
ncbi:precorrin-2 C(20)-methyltransferase [Thermodesulfatator atlanticus]|uniref:precorrin-2 C(20)-methyltransferase n=1 Tax=Thermodesulfatator atlanticus TaxID=501497 RepID=UPI0003B7B838|nr:precorrin-2 C(20)-methyltransferase [Thermodesulfatator atlanticus]